VSLKDTSSSPEWVSLLIFEELVGLLLWQWRASNFLKSVTYYTISHRMVEE